MDCTRMTMMNCSTQELVIINVLTIYMNLSHFHGVAVMLQSRTSDADRVYSMVTEVKTMYSMMRTNVEAKFDKIFRQALRLAHKLGVEPILLRIAGQQ